ncbi:MAG TPA: glycosyltransferase, partial [Rectinemataceae bacterium]|nr:glycosyltransferase [Rectinemataceae bacterium]
GGLKRAVYLWLEVFLSGMTDIILFQNRHELAQAEAHGMGRRASLRYLGNGIDFADFPAPRESRRKPKAFRLLCVARVEPKKNHLMLVRAVELLRRRYGHSNLELFCVGEVNDGSAPEEAKRLGLEAAIHFTGVKTKDEVAAYLSSCHISVLSSVAEGLPRGLMESMLFGLPCVATDVTGSNEVVVDGENGFLVPLGDHEAMAERIDRIIREDGLYERLSRRALEQALSRFDEDRVIGDLKAIYREAARARR